MSATRRLELDRKAATCGLTRSAFVRQAVEFALGSVPSPPKPDRCPHPPARHVDGRCAACGALYDDGPGGKRART